MLRLKNTVKLADLAPQTVLAAVIVEACYQSVGVREAWVTSANDSTHSERSLHYAGKALDFRIKNVAPEKRTVLVNNIRAALGEEFDVIWENPGGEQEHIHCEFDPC